MKYIEIPHPQSLCAWRTISAMQSKARHGRLLTEWPLFTCAMCHGLGNCGGGRQNNAMPRGWKPRRNQSMPRFQPRRYLGTGRPGDYRVAHRRPAAWPCACPPDETTRRPSNGRASLSMQAPAPRPQHPCVTDRSTSRAWPLAPSLPLMRKNLACATSSPMAPDRMPTISKPTAHNAANNQDSLQRLVIGNCSCKKKGPQRMTRLDEMSRPILRRFPFMLL